MELSVRILILTATVFTAISAFTLPPAQAASQSDLDLCIKERREAALAACTRVIDADPKHALAHYCRGRAYFDIAQFNLHDRDRAWVDKERDRAMPDFEAAIRLGVDPKYRRHIHEMRASKYFGDERFDAVIEESDAAIALNPKVPGPYVLRGRAYLKKGEPARALEDLDKAITIAMSSNSGMSEAALRKWRNEAAAALQAAGKPVPPKAGSPQQSPKKVEGGQDKVERGQLGLDKNAVASKGATAGRGDEGKTGKDDLDLADLDKAITLKPDNVIALTRRGELYAKTGKDDLALADFDKAITLAPGNVIALTRRGELYAKTGKDDLALADFDKAVALATPNSPAAVIARDRKAYILRRRAKAFYDKGAYEQAVKAYDAVLALDDAEIDKKFDRIDRDEAYCRINGGKDCDGPPAKEKETPRETAAVEPKKAPAANVLDKTLLASCDGKDAAKVIEACSELLKSENIDDQSRAHLYHMRGKAYAQLNKGNEALQDFIDAAKGSANPADVLIDRGELLRRYKKYDLAIKDFTAAAKLKNENGAAYFYRAMAFADAGQANADAGQIRQAERDLDQALQYLKEDKDGESDLIARAHVVKGNIAMGERQAYQSAAKEYLAATKIHGATIEVRLEALESLAQACQFGGQYGLARDMATNLIKFRPKYAPAYNTRGMAYDGLGQQDLAIADFDKAISLDPKVYTYAYLNNRGLAHFKKGEFALAVKDYDEAIRRKPDYDTAKKNKAKAEAALAKKQ